MTEEVTGEATIFRGGLLPVGFGSTIELLPCWSGRDRAPLYVVSMKGEP
ncbi:MAG: hypothetical protein QOH48_1539 [Actinomycetota bacterium]|nr:hypothetical protein [Actinomycetota bacterium]